MHATLEHTINPKAKKPNFNAGVFKLTETSAISAEFRPIKKAPIPSARLKPIYLQFSYKRKEKKDKIMVFWMIRSRVLELVLQLITKLDTRSLCDVIDACSNAIRNNVSNDTKK